jgi:hypothetical protein
MALKTDYTNTTPSTDTHPGAHNTTNTKVNELDTAVSANAAAIAANTAEVTRLRNAAEGDLLRGIVPLDRRNIAAQTTIATGRLLLGYATSRENLTLTKMRFMMGTTAAGATPTLVKLGIYREETDKSITLLGQTANDPTMCNTINAAVERPLAVAVPVTAGTRYAVTFIIVTAAAAPGLLGSVNQSAAGAEMVLAPRVCGTVTSQTDLPATVAAGSIGVSNVLYYMAAIP